MPQHKILNPHFPPFLTIISVIGRRFYIANAATMIVNIIYGSALPLSFALAHNGISFLTVP